MKQETLYRCEICNTAYNNKEICKKCEKSHHIPREIAAGRYRPITNNQTGYPDCIIVVFDDGSGLTYKRG